MKPLNLFSPSVSHTPSTLQGPSSVHALSNPLEQRSSSRQRRAVLALGGGGARGLAHLGVLQSIVDSGIRIERIIGVSMGSLVGALCAVQTDMASAQAKAIELIRSPVFQKRQRLLFGAAPPSDEESAGSMVSWYGRIRRYLQAHRQLSRVVTSPSLISADPLRDSIEFLLPDIDLQDLRTPLSIVAVDLRAGQRVVLETGSLRQAVLASSAIPGVFPPVEFNGMLLSDIGVIESVPALVASIYATDLTIAVDVGQDRRSVEHCGTAMEVMLRIDDICEQLIRRKVLESADVIIRPDVGKVAWFDFSDPERLIREGLEAGHQSLRSLQQGSAA